jgi:uncharacterized protein YaaR (DUF327 family)
MPRRHRKFLDPLSSVKEDAYRRVLDAIALKRRKPALSLTRAAKSTGTTVKTIRRHAVSVIEVRSGRLDVKATDRLKRQMRMLTPKGEIKVDTTSSRTASRLSKYNNAVRKFVITGDPKQLKPFSGKSIRSGGEVYEFVTDETILKRLERAGELHFLDVYVSTGGA